ncbi:hypothetical protein [Treponema endosymbiont of Eucomonympha sp.]|uniref:hypothetical protein n=1 Tax=Treponema endosymbiont of Eucomonympha sp. TaxID=1580831 RepID=UPI000751456C|nr:hypothetical protein [Treponema endosymbiont of Eucomonympha sp.]
MGKNNHVELHDKAQKAIAVLRGVIEALNHREPINPALYDTALKEIGDGAELLLKGGIDLGMSYVLPPDSKT